MSASPWPPVTDTKLPATSIRGPGISPRRTLSRNNQAKVDVSQDLRSRRVLPRLRKRMTQVTIEF
jgi:hypothetical protein